MISIPPSPAPPHQPPPRERALAADPLAALGASPASARILRFFAVHPTAAVHGRALQRLLDLGSASVQREVDRLLAFGALERVEDGHRVCYRPVLESKLWAAVMLLLSDTRDLAGLLRDALCDVSGIEAAFVFGSCATGSARPDSDVDVFVVETPAVDRRALHRQLAQVGLVLNREVNAVRYTAQALGDRLGNAAHPAHRFTRAALDGPKLWVAGSADRLSPLAAAAGLSRSAERGALVSA
jgi:predicted nucleotidyltransferase